MGWRGKLILILIVYFAGFATAIYCLAPVEDELAESSVREEESFAHSMLKSDSFAVSVRTGMDKCVDIGMTAAGYVDRFVRERISEREQTDG